MHGINVCVVLILLLIHEDDEIIKFTFVENSKWCTHSNDVTKSSL